MKYAKRIVLGLLGTAALTSFILSALHAYSEDQAASHPAVQANPNIADKTTLADGTALHAKDEMLSIGTSERHMLYQPQDTASSQATGNAGAAQLETIPTDTAQSEQDKTASSNTAQSRQNKTTSSDTVQSGQGKTTSSDTIQSGQGKTASSDTTQSGKGKTVSSDTTQQDKTVPTDTTQPGKDQTDSSDQQRTKTDNASNDKKTGKKSGSQSDQKNGQAADKSHNTFQTVTKDYFSDALFIGDSRTVGMLQSHLLPEASYYAKTGIGIGEILSKPIVNEGGRMISIKDALSLHSFGKVYIMIGINDIAAGDTGWFTEQYENILETVRQTQPDAVVYIQGNIPMSYGTQDLNGALNNKNLSIRNEASRALADEENVFYLDIGRIYADANGNLQSIYTTDGLHVSSSYYPLWVDYLMQHAIVR